MAGNGSQEFSSKRLTFPKAIVKESQGPAVRVS